ncbi:MAG: DUF1987 family protein [Bacteroidales bacterium]|nr:DUF1987 family protein [Bacteroidales bacterium]
MNSTTVFPTISFDKEKGTLSISGVSIPENPPAIFEPLIQEVIEYCKNPAPKTNIIIDLDYANTASTKWIFHILERFERIYIDKHVVVVNFFYADNSIFNTGRYYADNLALPLDFIKK